MKKFQEHISNLHLHGLLQRGAIALLLILLPPLFAQATASAAAPAFVQVKTASGNLFARTLTVTLPSVQAGNLLAVYTDWSNTGNVTISDNKNNSYAPVGQPTRFGSANNGSSQVFYAKNTASGNTTVTVRYANYSTADLYVVEYKGLSTTSPLGAYSSAKGNSNTPNSGNITTTTANELLFGAGALLGASPQTPGSGYTFRSTYQSNIIQDKTAATVGSYNASATISAPSEWVMHAVAFKPAGDTSAPSVPSNVTAVPASASQINLSWTASTDNTAVAGYRVYRNNVLVGSPSTTNFSDTGLSQNTTYTYTVAAIDASQNLSAQSTPVAATTLTSAPPTAHPLFKGDFETGNFSQWAVCQLANFNNNCSSYGGSQYGLTLSSSIVRQGNYSARFEVRDGDVPPFGGGERSEIQGDSSYEGGEGAERWYQWSTRFDSTFPTNHTGWGVFSQWHAFSNIASPPVSLGVAPWAMNAGNWGLIVHTYNSESSPITAYVPWQIPFATNTWQDIKMHVKWSPSDSIGYIELWLNGNRQTFTGAPCAGQVTCKVRTMIPNDGGVYFKQGYYRDAAMTQTGIIYHDGFSVADSEANLNPL